MWRRLLVILAIGIVLLILAERFGQGGRQRRGGPAAQRFVEAIEPKLRADSRFSAIEVSARTNPCVEFFGQVPDDKALADLKVLTQPPLGAEFDVVYLVQVSPTTTTQPPP